MTQPLRVLVVDDFPDATEAICMLLELLGHEARAAVNGRDGLAAAEAFDPHVVILDVGLPDLSGFEVARELRRRAQGRPLHLAAVTGWGLVEDRVKALAAGFDQHFLKPANATVIENIVEAAQLHFAQSPR
jgi:DNA-binding response OmpR family regulator